MAVDWETVETIAATESLDVWYWFPLMGLYRQAANEGFNIDPVKRARLNRVLGTTDWESQWYDTPHGDLFDYARTAVRTANLDTIEAYVKRRLASVFKGGVLDPMRILNKQNLPLASLFFAVSNPNPRAAEIAMRIARHILRMPAARSIKRGG